MKNKSKRKKMQAGTAGRNNVMQEWLYMNPGEITVMDICNALQDMEGIKPEVWELAGVLEVEVPEQRSMDIEAIEVGLEEESGNAFLKEHDIHSLFQVTIDTDNYAFMQQIMKTVTEHAGGFFCGDTQDFNPVIK